jgi:hypothetical protein
MMWAAIRCYTGFSKWKLKFLAHGVYNSRVETWVNLRSDRGHQADTW